MTKSLLSQIYRLHNLLHSREENERESVLPGFLRRKKSIYENQDYDENINETDILKCIRKNDFDPNERDEFGNTPLILACRMRMPKIALLLIESGNSNPSAQNKEGDTALIYACTTVSKRVALALIATGKSNPGVQNNNGDTALIYACYAGMDDVAIALIELPNNEANIGARGLDGETALIYACKRERKKVALALIDSGYSNINNINVYGETALEHLREQFREDRIIDNNMKAVVKRLLDEPTRQDRMNATLTLRSKKLPEDVINVINTHFGGRTKSKYKHRKNKSKTAKKKSYRK